MVGITGWIDFSRPIAAPGDALEAMARGLGNGLGGDTISRAAPHAGLALSAHPRMASSYFDDRLWAVIHGYPRWRDEGLAATARDDGHGRALADGYKRFGRDVLQKIGGPCSFAIVDLAERAALAAIDGAGIESICYATPNPGALVFGTRTTAVARHPAMTSTISREALYGYVHGFVVKAPTTIFQEQKKLLCGTYVELRGGTVKTGRYRDVDYTTDTAADLDTLACATRERLRDGVSRAIDGEDIGHVGAFLSGGLDSSTVSGLLKEVGGRARTFTVGFDDPRYDESDYARMAVERFKTEHTAISVTPEDVLELMPHIGEVYDEPFGNTSLIAAFYCAKRARESGVELMLAGDGGDELFGGNRHYYEMMRIERYGALPRLLRSCLIEPVALKIPGLERIKPVYKARRWIQQYRVPMPERMKDLLILEGWRTDSVFAPGYLDGVDLAAEDRVLREIYFGANSESMLQRMLHLDMQVVLADNDLRKVSRVCELAGVRVRYPMLDDDLVELSGRIPPDALMSGPNLRVFYKQAFRDFLPEGIINKKKHGFGLPAVSWLMNDGPLRDYIQACLSSIRSRHILHPDFITDVANYRNQPEPYEFASMAMDLSFLELWLQTHVDAAGQTTRETFKIIS